MPDPSVIRDNKARISTNTPANKIQSNQFTAGHGMAPGQNQRGRSSIPGLNNKVVRPTANTTADRNMMNQARRPTTTGAGTPMGADRAMMNSATAGATGGLGAIDWVEVQKRMNAAASADKKFMPQAPSSTGSTTSSYNMNPRVVSDADRKFMPSADGTPSSYNLGAPNNQGLFGYQPPVSTPTNPLGVNFDMKMLEEAIAMQQPSPANTMGTILSVPTEAYEIPTTTTVDSVEPLSMGDMGDMGGMGGDYGGDFLGGNTGNLGITTPDEGEYLKFGTELAGLENQEGMVDESRAFWDISQERKWDEIMRQIPGLFNQRGMADSGLLNRANALSLGDREFETSLRDWMDENQKSAINRGQMAAEQGLMQSQLQNMFDMFGSGAITPMNQPTVDQMDPMGVFNQTADAIAQGPRDYYGTNPTMDQLNAFNAGTGGMSVDQKDALSRLFASNAGII